MTTDRLLLAASTLFAAIAAFYAFRAVSDARAFHREQERDAERERLHMIAVALGELAPVAYTVRVGGAAEFGLLRAMLARFRAAVETSSEPLPLCRGLAEYDLATSHTTADSPWQARGGEIEDRSRGAFDELHEAIRRLG